MNILIQGGGRGIGLALARRALAAGAERLVVTARDPGNSAANAELGGDARVTFLPLDITDDAGIGNAAGEIRALVPRLDRVICTSGILREGDISPEKRIADIDAEALVTLYRVNALGPVLLARELWPLLKGDHALQLSAISARVGSVSDNRLGGWYGYRQQGGADPADAHPVDRACARQPECLRGDAASGHCRYRPVKAVSGECAGRQAVHGR